MKLPDWLRPLPAKETALQWSAAIVSFGGTVVMTVAAGILVYIIWKGGWSAPLEGKRLDLLGWAMILTLSGSISSNWAFGFVLSQRTLKIDKDGLEISGGNATTTTTTTATVTPPSGGNSP